MGSCMTIEIERRQSKCVRQALTKLSSRPTSISSIRYVPVLESKEIIK